MVARLVLLARVPELKAGQSSNAFIILIPGIGTDLPSKWDDFACSHPMSWVGETATRVQRRTAVYEFEHKVTVEDLPPWDTIIRKGDDLLNSLISLAQGASPGVIPDVHFAFVCHSLGGIMLKSALVNAKLRGDEASLGVLALLTGIIFLSTPHLRDENKLSWSNVLRILHSRSEKVAAGVDTIASLECIATLSQNFEDLTLPVPTLSIYEKRSTKLRSRFSAKDQNGNHVLVPKKLAQTSAGLEHLLEIDADHHNICRFTKSQNGRKQVLDFATETFDKDDMERPSYGRLHNIIFPTEEDYESPGADSDSDEDCATGEGDPAVPNSMANLTSHPNLALLQERDHTAAAVVQHKDQATSKFPGLSKVDIADVVDPTASSSSIPQTSQEAPDPALPCILLEPGVRVKDFSGREEIRKILRQVLVKNDQNTDQDIGGLSTFALCGIGGIGKTSVAADFVWMCRREKLFDAIFWIRADSVGKIRDTFSRIAIELGLQSGRQGRDRDVSTRLVLDWLENPVKSFNAAKNESKMKANWLIVYDNVDKHEILGNFWPISSTGSILMTSRDPVAAFFETEVLAVAKLDPKQENSITMQPFTLDEAISFLVRLSGQGQDDADTAAAAEVVKVLDCIPLALRQMAGIMKYRDISFQEFMEMYKTESTHSDLFAEEVKTQTADYQYNLSTVWGLHELEQDSATLMNVLSLLDPDHISESLLQVKKEASVANFLTDYGSYTKARAKLWRLSLISRIKKKQELKIHRIVQATARTMMSSKDWCVAFKTACALLLASWPKNKRVWNYTTDTWDACDKILPHMVKMIDHYQQFEHDKKDLDDPEFVRLLIYSGWYYHDRGNSDEAKPFFELANMISTGLGDTGYETMSEIHSSQGAIATETNDAEGSMMHYKELMAITEKQYEKMPSTEEGDISMAIACNELGIARMMNDDNDDALANFQRAQNLTLYRIKSLDERAFRFFCLSSTNLGLVYWVRKRLPTAKNILERALEMAHDQASFERDDSFIYGRLYHALGNVYESSGDAEKGLNWHEKAFKHYEDTVGIDHHRTADVAVRLADHHRGRKSWERAKHYLSIAEKVFNPKADSCYKPELARMKQRKYLLLKAQGDIKDAKVAESEARSLYNQVYTARRRPLPQEDVLREDYDQLVTFWSR